jgi:TonB family protein
MSTTPTRANDGSRQSDLLLWAAAAAVAVMGGVWLLLSKPWVTTANESVPVAAAPAPTQLASAEPLPNAGAPGVEQPDAEQTTLDNPLRMAKLAYDAGMLVEPEEYSAWTLYSRVLKSDPKNQDALDGISRVADDLVVRGETALEQGRFDDARATVERIRAVLPEHVGAKTLADKIWPNSTVARNPSAEKIKPELPAKAPPPAVAPVAIREAAPPAKPAVDPLVQANKAFEEAMAASRLLTPADESAKHFLGVMIGANKDSALTRRAQQRLSAEFLSRASQSLEGLDTEAAGIWIDEAQAIGVDAAGIAAARTAVTDQRVSMESMKPLPASELKVVKYVAPEYPQRALERRIEGWVDLEFTVATDGTTRDIVVADASNESYFRREATAAVEQWRFEPRIFMGRTIEQRTYTRIRFVQ